MKVKAVIFDFDDTLTDNKVLDFESFRYLSSSLGLFTPSRQQIRQFRCKSSLAKDIISWMIAKSEKPVSIEYCMQARNEFLKKTENGRFLMLKPNLRSILKKLKSKGYVLLIATSRTDSQPLKAFLRSHELENTFKKLYTSDSLDKTRAYRNILQDSELNPDECLVVSSTFQDLLPALNFGMHVIGIKGSYGFDPALRGNVKVVRDFHELYACIEKCAD